MDEAKLIEKLRLVEALFAGAATEGERNAAGHARDRILERLERLAEEDPPVEYRFSMVDMWSRKVFVALLRRYGIQPYRYSGQRYTTVMARVPKRFVDDTLWPEFQEISETLERYLAEVTDRVLHRVIHRDSSEAEVIEEPRQLPMSPEAAVPAGPGTAPTPQPPEPGQGQGREGRSPTPGPRGGGRPGRAKSRRKKGRKRKRR